MNFIRTKASTLLVLAIAASLTFLNSCSGKTETDEFNWTFTGKNEIVYDYTQDFNTVEDLTGDTVEQSMKGTATLIVTPKNDSMADIKMANMSIDVITKAPGVQPDTGTTQPPEIIIPNMKADGEFEDGNTHILYRLLFPLPDAKMPRGETHVKKLDLPVRVGPSKFQCKGYIQLTRKQKEEYKGIDCEVFYAEFKMDDLQVPEGTIDQYMYDFYGSATYYFDPKVGQFVAADMVAFTYMHYETDLEADKYTNNTQKNESSHHYELRNLSAQ